MRNRPFKHSCNIMKEITKNVLDIQNRSIFIAVNISVLWFWYVLPVTKMLYTETLHEWFTVKQAFCSRIWHSHRKWLPRWCRQMSDKVSWDNQCSKLYFMLVKLQSIFLQAFQTYNWITYRYHLYQLTIMLVFYNLIICMSTLASANDIRFISNS